VEQGAKSMEQRLREPIGRESIEFVEVVELLGFLALGSRFWGKSERQEDLPASSVLILSPKSK
jgi:hypothetical protein